MDIIQIKGPSGVGKSSTICRAYELLKKHGKVTAYEQGYLNRYDFHACLNISGLTVFIISQGDHMRFIKKHYEALCKESKTPNIMLCATRTRGGTVEFIKKHGIIQKTLVLKKIKGTDDRENAIKQNAKVIKDYILSF